MWAMLEQRIEQHFIDSADLKYQAAQVLSKPIAAAISAILASVTSGGKMRDSGSSAALPATRRRMPSPRRSWRQPWGMNSPNFMGVLSVHARGIPDSVAVPPSQPRAPRSWQVAPPCARIVPG